uniref:Uncharacterized protein n=1 Tax=Glossina pallidipes TaxID=7398 RepID=A0A1A9ZCG4_GLOPL
MFCRSKNDVAMLLMMISICIRPKPFSPADEVISGKRCVNCESPEPAKLALNNLGLRVGVVERFIVSELTFKAIGSSSVKEPLSCALGDCFTDAARASCEIVDASLVTSVSSTISTFFRIRKANDIINFESGPDFCNWNGCDTISIFSLFIKQAIT